MTSEKKFFPVLYPVNRDLRKHWFIKYTTEDWVNGGLKYEKYVGLLNRVDSIEERLQLAEQYITAINKGEALPNYQGARNVPSKLVSTEVTSVVACCERFLKLTISTGIRPATVAQIKSKLNNFYTWLRIEKLEHKAIGGITEEDAQDFIAYLSGVKKLSATHTNAHKALLSRVWNLYKKKLKDNPWADLPIRKGRKIHLASYPDDLRIKISDTLPSYDNQLWLILQTVYYCAIRPRAELRKLQIKHIDFINSTITVPEEISKTNKTRTVFVYHELIEQLKAAGYQNYPAEYYIFSHNGMPGIHCVGKNHYGRKWENYRKAFSIPSIYKIYGSKHTAGKAIASTLNTYIAKEHFDHTTTAMTDNYITGIEKEKLRFLITDYPKF